MRTLTSDEDESRALGPPIRPEPAKPAEKWEPVIGSKTVERNSVTGNMRNVAPTPPPKQGAWPFFG